MEIIIGREEGNHRLHIVAGGRQFNIGGVDSVPASVSRQHCQLSVDSAGQMTLKNLKERNFTYVDGRPIDTKKVTRDSIIELGSSRFRLDLSQVMAQISPQNSQNPQSPQQKTPVPTYSLRPLKSVWENYERQRDDLGRKTQNLNVFAGASPIFTIGAGALSRMTMDPDVQTFSFVMMIVGVCVTVIAVFLRATDKSREEMKKLDDNLMDKYSCPNPNCGCPFGKIPYRQLEFKKSCPSCSCKYTH